MKVGDPLARLIAFGEGLPGGAGRLTAVFAVTVFVRNLLECAGSGILFAPEAYLLHFPIAYVLPMLGIVAAMHLMSGYPVSRLMKLMTWAWTLTILPPLIDAAAGIDSSIGYFPLDRSNALRFLLDFFNPSRTLPGTTAGIRIEATIGCILGGVFIGKVSGSAIRGVMGSLLLAPLFLMFFGRPGIVNLLAGRFFPYTGDIQDFMQWHSLTRPHLMNSVHSTVFLVDLWPAAAIGLWLIRRIGDERGGAGRALAIRSALNPIASAVAGTIAAAATASAAGTATFADAAAIAGALFASLSLATTIHSGRNPRIWGALVALLAAGAVGWPTFVAALLTAALSATTTDRRLSAAFTSPALLLTAASPLFSTPGDTAALWPLLLASAATASLAFLPKGGVRIAGPAAACIPAAALLAGPYPVKPAQQVWMEETTDSFMRSSRNQHALVSASILAGHGGSTAPLAQSAHIAGRLDQAEWLCRLAAEEGNLDRDMLQVAFNLSIAEGDRARMLEILSSEGMGEAAVARSLPAVLGYAANAGDTLFLRTVFRTTGSSAMFLEAWSRALLVLGDTSAAFSFSRAAIQAPDAGPSEYAYAAGLAAIAGNDPEDMLREADSMFPGARELDLCRVRISVGTGEREASEGAVARMLSRYPRTSEELYACALWLLDAGLPDSALAVVERSLMMQYPPSEAFLELAAACAEAAGDTARADIHRDYLRAACCVSEDIPGPDALSTASTDI